MAGYPNFGQVKTIVLPVDRSMMSAMTLPEYKEKFGIDLLDIIELKHDTKDIVIKNGLPNTLLLIDDRDVFESYFHLNFIHDYNSSSYVSGSSDAKLELIFVTRVAFLSFVIDKDAPFDESSIFVIVGEI